MAEEIIYVGINEPKQYRKEILTSAVDIIQLLKNHERYKKIEKEKNIYRNQLVKNINQLRTLFKGFDNMIPKTHLPELPKKKAAYPKIKVEKGTKQIKRIVKKPVIKDKEIEKLELDIASLKSKINRL